MGDERTTEGNCCGESEGLEIGVALMVSDGRHFSLREDPTPRETLHVLKVRS